MKLTKVLAIGMVAASLGLSVAQAQSFSPMDSPAEFPPASYKGKQYVDSRGCVYIRAGIDGSVAWVPRVNRDRKVICGFKPTFDKPTAGLAPAAKLDKNVVQIQPATEPSEKPSIFGTSKPKTTTKTTAKTATKPAATATVIVPKTTVTVPAKTTVVVPKTKAKTTKPLYTTTTAKPKTQTVAPTTTVKTTTAPAKPAAAPRRATTQPPRASGAMSICRSGASTYKGLKVRCGPQAELPYTPGTGKPSAVSPKMQFNNQEGALHRGSPGDVVTAEQVHPETRVLPRHVYEANLSTVVAAQVPAGYRRVFDDGRLNERRAEMTMAGKSQMDRVWVQSLPRELVAHDARMPVVSSKSYRASSYGTASAAPTSAASAPVVSSRSEASEPALRLAGTAYVQVATYADADDAQAAARKIRKLGLPVRLGKYQSAGAAQRMVLAGPFTDVAQAQVAQAQAQKAGFSGAFVRK